MITVLDLAKTFREVVAVAGVSFTAPPGRITGFLGSNGAGKTTTMRILATLLRPSAGSATVAGYDVADSAEDVRRSIGLLTEETGLYDKMTPREQLRFFGSLYDLPAARVARRVDELAETLGFEEFLDRRAGTLSKGNRQKVAVARALVHDPPVLLLDEPTSGLDLVAASALEGVLTSEALSAKTVLLSTHVAEEAARLCAGIVVIVHGRIVADGTPQEIVRDTESLDLRTALVHLMNAEPPIGAQL
ncbi:MAG: ATP-binding cassette domain-containing protein [Actinomycetota bacterium]